MPRSPAVVPLSVALLFAVLLAGCRGTEHPASKEAHPRKLTADRLDSDRARASYLVGMDLARDLAPIKDEIDLDLAQQAMRESLAGEKPLLDQAQLDRLRGDFNEHLRAKREAALHGVAAANLAAGKAFLAGNAHAPGVVTTASGLQYRVLRAGRGPHPAPDATVSVHYVGRTLDGVEFANTYAGEHAEAVPLARVMPGLAEGVALMTPGSRYRFWIPARLGYGEAGHPGDVAPNATLVFDIELLEVADTDAAPVPRPAEAVAHPPRMR